MFERDWTLVFGRDWWDPISGFVLGLGLACPAYAFVLAVSADPLVVVAGGLVAVVGVLYVARLDPGLLATWLAMAPPFYSLVSAPFACRSGYGPGVLICPPGPPEWVIRVAAVAVALLVSIVAYLAGGTSQMSRVQRLLGGRGRGDR